MSKHSHRHKGRGGKQAQLPNVQKAAPANAVVASSPAQAAAIVTTAPAPTPAPAVAQILATAAPATAQPATTAGAATAGHATGGPPATPPPKQPSLMKTIARSICALVLIGLFVWTLCEWRWAAADAEGGALMDEKPFDDLVQNGIDMRVELARSLFQVGLLVAGALWAETILKMKVTPLLVGLQQRLMFFIASVLLLLSFYAHVNYLDVVSTAFYDSGGATATDDAADADADPDESAGSPTDESTADASPDGGEASTKPAPRLMIVDVWGPYMSQWLDCQNMALRCGFIATVTCFLSAYFFRYGP